MSTTSLSSSNLFVLHTEMMHGSLQRSTFKVQKKPSVKYEQYVLDNSSGVRVKLRSFENLLCSFLGIELLTKTIALLVSLKLIWFLE